MSGDLKGRVDEYLRKAEPLFENLVDAEPGDVDFAETRVQFREMAFGYYSDARHFYGEGDYVNALAALEYAEGWLDAGKRLGVFRE